MLANRRQAGRLWRPALTLHHQPRHGGPEPRGALSPSIERTHARERLPRAGQVLTPTGSQNAAPGRIPDLAPSDFTWRPVFNQAPVCHTSNSRPTTRVDNPRLRRPSTGERTTFHSSALPPRRVSC